MYQARKHMPVMTKERQRQPSAPTTAESLMQYTTQGAIPPQLRGQLKDHKEGYQM